MIDSFEASPVDGRRRGMDETLDYLRLRKRNIEAGGVNCIPFPFRRFNSEVPGIEQGQYVIVTANTKVGKSQLTNYLYVYTPLDYALNNPDKCRVRILYFTLEETPERIRERYLSHLIWQMDSVRIAPADLRSTSTALPDKVLRLLESDRYKRHLDFFDKSIRFIDGFSSASQIRDTCVEVAKRWGSEEDGRYVQKDSNLYKIAIIDHISNINPGNLTLKGAIDTLSKSIVTCLRDTYGWTVVSVQQQQADAESLNAVKAGRTRPTLAGLADSRYTGFDANMVLGLFSPDRTGMARWPGQNGYDITRLRDRLRVMEVLANRDSTMGGLCPLLFDGVTCSFEEMPLPNDDRMSEVYERVESERRKPRDIANFITLIDKIDKKDN